MTQIIPGTPDGQFLDGPQWVDANGATGGFLVFSEYLQTPRLRKVFPDGGGAAPFRAPGFVANAGAQNPDVGPTGNAVRGNFVITAAAGANGTASSIFQTLIADGGAGPAIPIGAVGAISSPNDLVVGKGGQIYFTAPGFQIDNGQGIYQTLPDAGGVALIGAGATGRPNGIAISPDGTKLYVSYTDDKKVDAFPIAATGVVGTVATPVILAANVTDDPDGIAVDVGGNIYVAEANKAPGLKSGAVEVFNSAGKKLGRIPFTTDRPTGVAFGGGDKKALFITGENGVYKFSGRCAGLP